MRSAEANVMAQFVCFVGTFMLNRKKGLDCIPLSIHFKYDVMWVLQIPTKTKLDISVLYFMSHLKHICVPIRILD